MVCIAQITDCGRPMKPFLSKSQTFGLGQTIWADKFWVIWGIFGRFISTHFGTVSPLSTVFMDYVRDGKIQGQCALKRPKSGPVSSLT